MSDYVIKEIRHALERKVPASVVDLDEFLANTNFETAKPSVQEINSAAAYTELKDAPVVAAAVQTGADYLVSLDRKHLIGQPVVAEKSGLRIVLPADLRRVLRSSE